MSDSNFSAIRARLRYESIEEFIDGYARFISAGGMFIPMAPNKLKPIGTTIRFQFLLTDASTALLGEGVVVQVRPPDEQNSRAPVGMLVKFSKLSQESKNLVDQIVAMKETGAFASASDASIDEEEAALPAEADATPAADEPEEDPYERTHEMKLQAFLAMDSERRPDEPETAETPTAEAPEEPATREAPAADAATGPRKLGQTAGGLQILAFDDISDEEAQAMNFDLGAEESDIDEMFAGLFGGGDDGEAAGDPFGGSFGGAFGGGEGAPEGESSLEFELPDEEQFAALEAEGEPAAQDVFAEPVSEPHVSEPELSEPHVSEPELSEPHVSEPELSEPHVSEPEISEPHDADQAERDPALDEDELAAAEALLAAESEQTSDDDGYEFDIVASSRDLEQGPTTQDIDDEAIEEVVEAGAPPDADLGDSDSQSLELDSDAVELIEGSEMEELINDDEVPEPPSFQVDHERPSELENLLGNLESAPQHDDPSSLTLASSPDIVVDEAPAAPSEPEDEESLEFLLGLARHEIDSKHGDEKPSDDRDILDDLLGDDAGLPPPPPDTPVFNPTRPPAGKEKKGGFLSKLFGKD